MTNSPKKIFAEAGSNPRQDRLRQHVSRVDLSQIESAHRVVSAELYSLEAQRTFMRRFDLMQVNLHHVLVHGRSRAPQSLVSEAEERIRSQLEKSVGILNNAAALAERRLRDAGITSLDTDHLTPLDQHVKVFSSHGRRYLQLIGTFDQVLLMLGAAVRHGLMGTEEMDQQKVLLKTELRHVANLVRDLRNPPCARSEK